MVMHWADLGANTKAYSTRQLKAVETVGLSSRSRESSGQLGAQGSCFLVSNPALHAGSLREIYEGTGLIEGPVPPSSLCLPEGILHHVDLAGDTHPFVLHGQLSVHGSIFYLNVFP